jgi:hypothetical protein
MLRRLRDPGVDLAVLELLDAVAARADEMVMMSRAAQAVAGLAASVGELVDHVLLAQHRKRPVDGGEADTFPALT